MKSNELIWRTQCCAARLGLFVFRSLFCSVFLIFLVYYWKFSSLSQMSHLSSDDWLQYDNRQLHWNGLLTSDSHTFTLTDRETMKFYFALNGSRNVAKN